MIKSIFAQHKSWRYWKVEQLLCWALFHFSPSLDVILVLKCDPWTFWNLQKDPAVFFHLSPSLLHRRRRRASPGFGRSNPSPALTPARGFPANTFRILGPGCKSSVLFLLFLGWTLKIPRNSYKNQKNTNSNVLESLLQGLQLLLHTHLHFWYVF